ncbi:MAG: 30S ribosomal protein S14 [Nanoarchaeota archaeon]
MTSKDYSKVYVQLEHKPAKWEKVQKHNKPKERPAGRIESKCGICGSTRAHIGKAGLHVCRRCFRLNAKKLGFKKLN